MQGVARSSLPGHIRLFVAMHAIDRTEDMPTTTAIEMTGVPTFKLDS